MITIPINNHVDYFFDTHRFTTHTHGPHPWPTKWIKIHVCRWSGQGNSYEIGYNIWFYTRWGAWCHGIAWLKEES